MAYEGAWRRRTNTGWTAEGSTAPGREVDGAHRTGDLGDGEAGGAQVVAPGAVPDSGRDVETPAWSSWASGPTTWSGATADPTGDHTHLTRHDDAADDGLSRIVRRPPTAGEDYSTDAVTTQQLAGASTMAALRGRNSLPENNPDGIRQGTPRFYRRHSREGLFSGWLRQQQGRVSPPRQPFGPRAASPGGTPSNGARGAYVTGQRQTVSPGVARPGMLRRPPTSWDEEAVITATDLAAAPAPTQFWTL